MSPELTALLADAYGAKILKIGDYALVKERFQEKAKDESFVAEARSEQARLGNVRLNQRCFVSKFSADCLSELLADLPSTTPSTILTP